MDTDAAPPVHAPVEAAAGPACSRRSALRSLTAAGLVVLPGVLVAGCTGRGTGDGGSGGGPDGAPGGSDAPPSTVAASSVPVGTAVVVRARGDRVVLAQPTAGRFVAYSAVCTHAGGTVAPGKGTVVVCPLHGSAFDAAKDGQAVNGPAREPLPTVAVTVQGDQLLVG